MIKRLWFRFLVFMGLAEDSESMKYRRYGEYAVQGLKEYLTSLEPQKHLLLYQGQQAICPNCSGMLMTPEPMMKHCIDCHKDYICVGLGMADKELIYEEVVKDGYEKETPK